MRIIKRFNNLDGKTVRRKTLESILRQAQHVGNVEIVKRVSHLLNQYSDDIFEISVASIAIDEPLSRGYLAGLEHLNLESENGLGRVASSDIYEMVTKKMVAMVKEATGHNYKKKWNERNGSVSEGYLIPFNYDTKKPYRGVNIWMLKPGFYETLQNPFYLTFKQIEKNKGQLKKGSKGSPVIYYTTLYKCLDTDNSLNYASYDKNRVIEYLKKKGFGKNDEKLIEEIPILKYYNVFNGADIEGIDFDLENFKIGFVEATQGRSNERNAIADSIISNYPTPQPDIRHGGDRAYYSSADYIQMPNLDTFDSSNDYYRTIFHELTHSTGSPDRLSRDMKGRFGSKTYAKEELVAEFGAVFISSWAGIIWYGNENHAEYLKNWQNVLKIAENDNKFLMKASSQAQKATDYILNIDSKSGFPKFYEEIGLGVAKDINVINANFNRDLNLYNKNKHRGRFFEMGLPSKILQKAGLDGRLSIKLVKSTLTNKIKKTRL